MKNQSIWKRFGYALQGIQASIRTERSFRAHIAVAVFVVAVLLVTRPAPLWWGLMLLTTSVMMAVELVNTAVEKLVDFIHPGQHEVIGVVKDTLAGAVLVVCTAGVFVFAAFLWMELAGK
jgi:diacylglycerol kinase (ATP)